MRHLNRTPPPPPELTPADGMVFAGYFILLHTALRSGSIAWACIAMLPMIVVIGVLVYWDDLL
jgi:hypothetical protein